MALNSQQIYVILKALFLAVLGVFVFYKFSLLLNKKFSIIWNKQAGLMAEKFTFYTGLVLIAMLVLHQLGFKISALLGAAGILGIAIGFASQTVVSNLISGVFLLSEKTFQVGDQINVDQFKGIVLSIDLLSVKLRTYENHLIRIPNEVLLKHNVVNVTHFPIRRCDIPISVGYGETVAHVKEVLQRIISNNKHALQNPKPLVVFESFDASSLAFKIGVWAVKEEFMDLKQSLMEEIKITFEKENIEIPYAYQNVILKKE